MKVEIMEITPALAEQWLTTNTENRPIRKTVVTRYQGDMERGEWQLNGEAIVLNGNRVLDGQHRLLACVQAGKSFRSVVVTDAPTAAMQTIDQGVSRSFGDVLRWRGYADQNHLASAIRTGWRWDNGVLLQPVWPSINQLLQWLDENERIVSAARFAKRLTPGPLKLRGSVGAAVYYKALEADAEAATEFFDRLLDGEHLSHGDPVYALRKTLMNNAARTHAKLNQNTMLAFVVKAWNAWVLREPLEMIRWGRGTRAAERFPVMVDLSGNPISKEQSWRTSTTW